MLTKHTSQQDFSESEDELIQYTVNGNEGNIHTLTQKQITVATEGSLYANAAPDISSTNKIKCICSLYIIAEEKWRLEK